MVSRREYLHACSAGALGALAGCTDVPFLGGDGDSEPALVASQNVHRDAGFGRSIGVGDDVLVVGAQNAINDASYFGGAAFLYERDDGEWAKQARLQPHPDDFAGPHYDDPAGRLTFGSFVTVEDGVAVVGTARSPAAYTYERSGNGWQRMGRAYPDTHDAVQERIYPNAPDGISGYGTSMAFDGETIVLATQCEVEDAEPTVETVHVFEYREHEWREVAALQRDDPREGDLYGHSVDVDGDTLAVASTVGRDSDESAFAVVYVYERTDEGWTEVAEIRPGAYFHGLGSRHTRNSIAISGDTLVVGDLMVREDGDRVGRGYVYERDDGDWERVAMLHPDDLNRFGQFGGLLDFRGDTLVAGSPGVTLDTGVRGSAFRYERSGGEWSTERRYSESDAVREGDFGHAVALSENHVAIGGKVRRDDLADQEVVYVFPR